MWAKQSTAATLIVGPVLDSTGAEHTGLIIGDLSLSKNGGTLTALAAAATLTHIANGQYTLVMTTGNLDTLGRVQITCNKSTYQMPTVGLLVVPAMVFDSMVLGTDVLQSDVTQFGGTAGTFAAGIPTAVLDSADKATLVDLIWDEPLTGATHNVATSSGKRLRQTTAFQQIDSTVIDASATTTTFVTGLTSSVDNFYNDSMLVFTDGALAGQVRAIYDYIGATKTIILAEALTSAPVNGVAFTIVSLHIHPVSQIQSGLATAAALATESTKITAIETFATRVTTGLVADGAVYQFTANMLELGPAGGAATVAVLPATGIAADRSAGTTLNPVVGETISQSITVYQSDGTTAVSLSGKTLKVIFETMSGVDVAVVLAADITISGASSNVVTFAYPSAVTASERTLRFAIRDAASPLTMYLQGVCSVIAAPKVDA